MFSKGENFLSNQTHDKGTVVREILGSVGRFLGLIVGESNVNIWFRVNETETNPQYIES